MTYCPQRLSGKAALVHKDPMVTHPDSSSGLVDWGNGFFHTLHQTLWAAEVSGSKSPRKDQTRPLKRGILMERTTHFGSPPLELTKVHTVLSTEVGLAQELRTEVGFLSGSFLKGGVLFRWTLRRDPDLENYPYGLWRKPRITGASDFSPKP